MKWIGALIVWAVGTTALPSLAGILNDWQFDDPLGTGLNGVSNSVDGISLTFGSAPSAGWQTDGNGLLVDTSSIDHFKDANIPDILAGKSFLRIEYDSWNFSTSNTEAENIAVGFRDNEAPSSEANLVLVRAVRTGTNTVTLRISDDAGINNIATYPAQGFTNGLDVVLGVDLDANTYEVYYREGNDPFALGGTGAINETNTADKIRFHSQNSFGAIGEFMSVDRLYHGETLEDVGVSGLLNDWPFADPVGTELNSVENVGLEGAGFGSNGTAGLATDGNGVLVDATATDHFRQADIVDITSGGAYLRLDVAGWNFPVGTGFNEGEQIAVGFRDAESNQNLVLAKLARRTNDTAVVLRVTDDTGTAADLVVGPPESFTNGLSVVVAVDMTADTYDVYYRTGADPFVISASGPINETNTADILRFHSQGDFSNGGESLRIDRLSQARTLLELGIGNEVPFTKVVVANTSHLAFSSQLGVIYRLERSEGGPGNWVFTGMKAVGDGGTMTLFDPSGSSSDTSYRIAAENPVP